jgi:uncharacterized membrane protein
MKKKISILIGSLLAAAVLLAGVRVTTAYAQDGTPPTPPAGQPGDEHGPGHGRRGLSEAALAAAAETLDMTTEEVSAALAGGETLADLAAAAGVDIEDVHAAIQAAHAVELRAKIEAGVADGSITQDKADWLLEGLEKGYLNGPGGFGFGGPRGDKAP